MTNPASELQKLYEFLGVDWSIETVRGVLDTESHGIRQHYTGIDVQRKDEWKVTLSKLTIYLLDKLYESKRKTKFR
jgi:hypothetical protein